MNDEEKFGFLVESTGKDVQMIADFSENASDKQPAQLEKDKAKRLASLDVEYKAGAISKELYESKKASIEQNYDDQTRAVKKRAAEEEKKFNIVPSIIQGRSVILKAEGVFNPIGASTAIFAAAFTAKIIATPFRSLSKEACLVASPP